MYNIYKINKKNEFELFKSKMFLADANRAALLEVIASKKIVGMEKNDEGIKMIPILWSKRVGVLLISPLLAGVAFKKGSLVFDSEEKVLELVVKNEFTIIKDGFYKKQIEIKGFEE